MTVLMHSLSYKLMWMASLVMVVISKVIQRLVTTLMTPLVLIKTPITMVTSVNNL